MTGACLLAHQRGVRVALGLSQSAQLLVEPGRTTLALALEIGQSAGEDRDLATFDHPQPIEHLVQQLQIMSRRDDGSIETLQHAHQRAAIVPVQMVGRLVEQQQARRPLHRRAQGPVQTLAAAAIARLGEDLGYETEPGDVVGDDPATLGLEIAAEHAQKRRLAATVVTDDGHAVACIDAFGKIGEQDLAPAFEAKIDDAKNGHGQPRSALMDVRACCHAGAIRLQAEVRMGVDRVSSFSLKATS
ncbi:hypothetical protein GALL_329890 [mine drainage metagenome]|uniref:Uncharacterized protein n=1 Tax=mine drainage metagenome TaxID=410659 RepID=A0A1J5RAM4_9ZZZZ